MARETKQNSKNFNETQRVSHPGCRSFPSLTSLNDVPDEALPSYVRENLSPATPTGNVIATSGSKEEQEMVSDAETEDSIEMISDAESDGSNEMISDQQTAVELSNSIVKQICESLYATMSSEMTATIQEKYAKGERTSEKEIREEVCAKRNRLLDMLLRFFKWVFDMLMKGFGIARKLFDRVCELIASKEKLSGGAAEHHLGMFARSAPM